MGHEFSGEIERVPAGGSLAPGQKVAIFPKQFCGVCETCKKGYLNLCPNADFFGVMSCDGAMTEYICVREQFLIPYSGIPSEIAALTEPSAVAYSAIAKLTDQQIAQAKNILLVGAGTIGLLALLWLKYRGARRVIVSDTFDFRLGLASKMGADAVINPAKSSFEQEIARLTDGNMCDYSVEAVGVSPTAQSSVDALQTAGTAIWIGNAAKMVSVDMQRIVTRELKIIGSYIFSLDDFISCNRLLSKSAVDVSPVITHKMALDQGAAAFDLLINNIDGKAIKVVLTNQR